LAVCSARSGDSDEMKASSPFMRLCGSGRRS
jgi:hypothetical protein